MNPFAIQLSGKPWYFTKLHLIAVSIQIWKGIMETTKMKEQGNFAVDNGDIAWR